MANLCPQLSQLLPLCFYSRGIGQFFMAHRRLRQIWTWYISILWVKVSWLLPSRLGIRPPFKLRSIRILSTPHISRWLCILSITRAFPGTFYPLHLLLKLVIPKGLIELWLCSYFLVILILIHLWYKLLLISKQLIVVMIIALSTAWWVWVILCHLRLCHLSESILLLSYPVFLFYLGDLHLLNLLLYLLDPLQLV